MFLFKPKNEYRLINRRECFCVHCKSLFCQHYTPKVGLESIKCYEYIIAIWLRVQNFEYFRIYHINVRLPD